VFYYLKICDLTKFDLPLQKEFIYEKNSFVEVFKNS